MKVIYTEAAEVELKEFQQRQKSILEELVSERKLVFGDDVLEITASDVKDASNRIRPARPTLRRYQSSELLTKAYIFMGISMMIGAYFFPQLEIIFVKSKTQAMIFVVGACITMLGFLFSYWLKMRQRRLEEQIEKYYMSQSFLLGSSKDQHDPENRT